ncbi:uncharacterized protein LOC122266373 [Penaeus japonicus]|uniref:uncharacterized protein LOC122266373 n=1 Tax=Penaeus japonicus TaxID=27405 RepID=UPI001C71496F|nr:uncharacterized protein LOC122266373 [Penaeus japonicus]
MASPHLPRLRVGDAFSSIEELDEVISRLEQAQNTTYWKRDARTIEAAAKRVKKPLNPALKYYQVVWACVKGGRAYKSKSTGLRPNQKTVRGDCGACIKVCASRDGQKLIVVKNDLDHNHPTTAVSTLRCNGDVVT